MTSSDDVMSMKKQGITDDEIIKTMHGEGMTGREIGDAVSQMKIKSAVAGNHDNDAAAESDSPESYGQPQPEAPTRPMTEEYVGMEQSVMSPSEQQSQEVQESSPQEYQVQEPAPPEYPAQEPAPPEYQVQTYPPQYTQSAEGTEQYTYQPMSISPDTMSEVAEQVVVEKIGPVVRSVDKLLDSRAAIEAQVKYMEDRLKRIEKIIDSLQLSLLQKVGEYVSTVGDMKNELAETQKTFKSMIDKKQG